MGSLHSQTMALKDTIDSLQATNTYLSTQLTHLTPLESELSLLSLSLQESTIKYNMSTARQAALDAEVSLLKDENSVLVARCGALEDEVEKLRTEIRATAFEPSPSSITSFVSASGRMARKMSGGSFSTNHNHTRGVSVISLTGSLNEENVLSEVDL
jgi:hypothetical protein